MKRRRFIAAAPLACSLLHLYGCGGESGGAAALDLERYERDYRSALMDDIVPFWERHGVDREYGGTLTGLADDGTLISDTKYTYSMARALWTFSTLATTIERRDTWVTIADDIYRFLINHALWDEEKGIWAYSMERDGYTTEGPVSIWSDCFACYGLIAYSRCSGDTHALDLALTTLLSIDERTSREDFDAIAPFTVTPGTWIHGVSMMEAVLSDEFLRERDDPGVSRILSGAVERILSCHLDSETGLIHETVGRDCRPPGTDEGRFILPGHAIESMWKLIRMARRTGDDGLAARAAAVMRRHIEAGTDIEYGGIFYAIDPSGSPMTLPPYPPGELKMWWVHTEALAGTMLALEATDDPWFAEHFAALHEYTFARFPAGPGLDWHERLTREGAVMEETINLPVKDFFHTPRMCLYVLESIGRMRETKTAGSGRPPA